MGGRVLGKQKTSGKRPDLQDRDLLVFRMLYKARVLTTGDFVPLAFPSLPVARRRLRKLTAAKYIAAYVESLHDETRYVLDRRGLVELAEEDDLDVSPRSAPKKLKGAGEHRLTLVRFWSRLVYECHTSPDIGLVRFQFEWEMAPEHLNTLVRFRPDATAVLDDGYSEQMFLVEADRSTESPSHLAKHKFAIFARAQAAQVPLFGGIPAGMLVLVDKERRLRSLSRALGSSRAPIFGQVFTRESEDPILGKTWHHLGTFAPGATSTVSLFPDDEE